MADGEIVPHSVQEAILLEHGQDGSVTLSQRRDADTGEHHYIEIAARHVPDVIRALQATIASAGSPR